MPLNDESQKALLVVFVVAVLAIIPAIWNSPEPACSFKRLQPHDIIVKYNADSRDTTKKKGPLRGKGIGSKDVKSRAEQMEEENYHDETEHQEVQQVIPKQQTPRGKTRRSYRGGSPNRDLFNMVSASSRPRGIYRKRSGWLARYILCLGRTFYCTLPSNQDMTLNLAKYNRYS